MTARTTNIITWVVVLFFLVWLAFLAFVFITSNDTPAPVAPTPQPETCQEVKPEVPAELPKTGVSL